MTTPDRSAIDSQRQHWEHTFAANPDMYGTEASEPGQYAVELFAREDGHDVLELGAGQGRDTFAFLAAGFSVSALDYEGESLLAVRARAESLGVADRLQVTSHDVNRFLTRTSDSMRSTRTCCSTWHSLRTNLPCWQPRCAE